MEDDIKNQIENIILTSPSVLRRAPTVAVEEHAPLAETPAMPAEQSTYQSNGQPAFRTNVSATEPEPIDVARYAGAGHLSNTRLANTEYGEKDALYYKTKYAPVVPFKTLYGNAQITTTTKAENKQGWEFDTSVLGMPDLRYVGYNKIEPPTENLIQAGARGVFNLISNFGETVGRFARNVTQATGTIEAPETVKAVMPYLTPRRPGADTIDNISAIYTAARDKGLINYDPQTKKITDGDGKPKEGGEPIDVLGAMSSEFASDMDNFARWSKDNLYWVYTDENETGMSDNARITYGLGSGLGTVALSVAAPWTAGIVSTIEAMGAFNDVFENNVANGVPVKRALGLATGTGATVGLLSGAPEIGGRITFNTLYQAERNLLKQARNPAAAMSLLNHSRQVTKNVSRTANVVTGIGEMITEPLQTDITLLGANNLDWSVFNTPRWDERAIEIGAAFLGSVVGGVVNTSATMREYDNYNQRATDFKERITTVIDEYRPLLEGAVKDGILTKEQMDQLISIAALPENYDYAMDFVKDSIAGQMDKVPASMLEDFQKRMESIDPNAVLSDEMKKLDENVLAAIAKANKKSKYPFTDEDAALIVSLFHGIAQWKLWQDGVLPSQIEIPDLDTFKRQPKNGVEYGSTTYAGDKVIRVTIGNNVLPTDMPSSAKPTEYDSLIPKGNPNVDRTISARHSNILHEIGGHLLESMVGIKGSGAFFDEFYRAISMAFGEKRAIDVKNAEDKSATTRKNKKGYTSPENKSENLAQAVGALAENAARVAGIEGTPADFVTFANLILSGMNKATVLVEGVRNYMSEIEAAIKENEDIVADLVNVFGTERTNSALKEFMSDDVKELSDTTLPAEFLAGLVEAVNGFASAKTIPVLRAMFAGVNPENFVEKAQRMFRDALAAGRLNVENATPANKALYAKAAAKAEDDALIADIINMLGPDAANLATDDLSEQSERIDIKTESTGDNGVVVKYDNESGIGATGRVRDATIPDTRGNLDWKTAVVLMSPDEYLALTPSMKNTPDSTSFIKQSIQEGKPIAMPFLGIQEESTDEKIVTGNNWSHEGRHRAQALKELGVKEMPVVIYGPQLQDLYKNGISGIEITNSDGTAKVSPTVITEPYSRGQIGNPDGNSTTQTESLEMSPFGLPTLDSFFVPDAPDANMTEAGKLLNSKVKDRTLSEDLDNTLATVKSTKQTKTSKIINALYKRPWIGTLADKLNSVGGEKLKNYFDLTGDAAKYEIKLRNLQSRFIGYIKKATNTNDMSLIALNSKLSQDVTKARVRSIPNSDIGAFEKPINGFVVMDLYLNKMQGENIFERTKAGYATGEVDRILNDYLTPEIKAYADGILEFYQSVKPDIEKARGKTIGLEEEFYAPVSNAFYSGLTAQSINSMMARTDRKSALVGEDALGLADKYIRRLASSLTGRYQTLKRLNDVLFLVPDKELAKNSTREEREEVERLKLLSSELRGAIRNVLGEDGLQNIRHDVENELAFNDVTPYVKSGALNKVSNATVTGLLSWNPLSFFKNAANITSFWGRTDSINQYLSDTMYALMHPKEAIEYMKSFDVVKNRLQGRGLDDLLNTDVAGGESVLTDVRNALKYNDKYNITGTIAGITTVANRFGLKAFMQNGDGFANIFGGYGYAKYLERQGMSHDEINHQLQKAVDETQASSNQAMKNALQKNWQRQGLLGNFIAFTQEPMAKSKTITDALMAFSRGEITAKEFGKRVAPIIMSVTIFAMISSGFMDLWSSDDKKRKEANKSLINEAIQAMSGITPFGNTFIAPFIEYAIGTMSNPTFSPSLITETRNALNDMSEGDIKGIGARALTFTGMLQGAPRLFNVIEGIEKQASDDRRTREIGSYQMWGRGERYAEKRVGKNK